MKFNLVIWRQTRENAAGDMVRYEVDGISPDMSFLEMLDVLNEDLVTHGGEPVAFDHDCREGICGMCSLVINGIPHGPERATTACQLHMRHFKDGETITIEPWRARAFPIIRDLVVDRRAFDRIIQAGGYISVNTGSAPDAIRSRLRRTTRIPPSKAPNASVVVLVSPLVRTPPRGSSWPPKPPTSPRSLKDSPRELDGRSVSSRPLIAKGSGLARITTSAWLPVRRKFRSASSRT